MQDQQDGHDDRPARCVVCGALCAAPAPAQSAAAGAVAARALMPGRRGGWGGAPDNETIGGAGAAAIAEALKINQAVTTIDMGGAFCAAPAPAQSAAARAPAARALMLGRRGGGGARQPHW